MKRMKHAHTPIKSFMFALAGLLFAAGCSNSFLPAPETAEEPAAAAGGESLRGELTISITGTDVTNGERTLLPTAPVSFSKYELVFTPPSGQENIPAITLTNTTYHSLTLPYGAWTVTALAYVHIQGVAGITNGDYVAARGSQEVTVTAQSTYQSITIDIKGGVDQGRGVFSYDVKLPADLDSASLAILTLNGSSVTTVNDLISDPSGSFGLDAGYYLLRISRTKSGGTSSGVEVIHIYEGWTTEAGGLKYDFTPRVSPGEIFSYLSDQGANTAANPYTVTLSGSVFDGEFQKGNDPLGLLFEAIEGKYVTLDFSAYTGDTFPDVYFYTALERPNKDKIVSVILPDSLTSIGESAFFIGFTSLTSIDLPDSITSISTGTFSGCTSLASVDLPDSLTSIPYGTFAYCTSLESIDLPASLTSIGAYSAGYTGDAFENCTALSTVISRNASPPTLYGSSNFDATVTAIYVPDTSVAAYKSAWVTYADKIKPLSEMP